MTRYSRITGTGSYLPPRRLTNAELAAVTSALEIADVAWVAHLPPVPATKMLGDPNNRNSRVANWLNTAARDGLIDRTTIPERLTP